MEVRTYKFRAATYNRLAFDPEAGRYVRETDEHDETRYYGVGIVGGVEVQATALYERPEDVPADPEPGMLPPDPSGFYAEAAITFGADKADEWMLSSPSAIRAIDAGNYALARAGIVAARSRGVLTKSEQDQMIALMDKYRLT
jgi:hypothetical protein